jgi:LemA protein
LVEFTCAGSNGSAFGRFQPAPLLQRRARSLILDEFRHRGVHCPLLSTAVAQHKEEGTVVGWIVLGLVVVAIAYAVMLYNGLVTVKNNVSLAWANIDVLLKQRHDEIPKLVEICRQYRQFEQETLEKVTRARSAVHDARETRNIGALGQAEATLRAGLGGLFAVAEAYPDLKANQNFMQLQNRITQLENAITDRRELYNDSVNINNVRIEQFPDSIIADRFGFRAAKLLHFDAAETADVDVKQLFSS